MYANIAGAKNTEDSFIFKLPNEVGFYEITTDQLKARIDDESDDNFIIIDIRDDASYDEAHIPGAINIPLNELGYRVFSLDKTKDIIVYCFTGVTSQVACQILVNAGFKDVYNVTGGIKAWNYAIETSDGRVNI
ncbi:rhodanese-like domain-containing protein [Planctomycetota bacterium]